MDYLILNPLNFPILSTLIVPASGRGTGHFFLEE